MEDSRPEDVECPDCNVLFSPSWDRVESRWAYPELINAGICHQCWNLRRIRQNIEACLQNAGVSPKYLHCSFKSFQIVKKNSFCVSACSQYHTSQTPSSPWLYLYGNCGTGKTHLATGITRELLLKGRQVLFTSGSGLCLDIKNAFKNNDRITEQEAIQPYLSCEFLVMDDIGGENPTEWDKKTIGYIINERDSQLKSAIITSNFSLDELADHIGQRTASRIAGMSQIIRIQGPDWRLKNRQENN